MIKYSYLINSFNQNIVLINYIRDNQIGNEGAEGLGKGLSGMDKLDSLTLNLV